jgi:signal peptidase I
MNPIPNDLFFKEVELLLSNGKDVELRVKGVSMQPYLRDGKDVVVLSPFSPTDLVKGKIVLLRYHDRYLLHRIVRCREERLIFQGDGANGKEEALPSDVIGIVNTVIRPNGRTVSTSSFPAQAYWRCWYFLRPFRRYLLAIYNKTMHYAD